MYEPKPQAGRDDGRSRGRPRLLIAGAVVLVLSIAVASWVAWRAGLSPGQLQALARERSLMDAVRYAERRLQGHPKLEAVVLPLLGAMRSRYEREPPPVLADLGKGQRRGAQVRVQFDVAGRPIPAVQALQVGHTMLADRVLRSTAEIADAIAAAQAGEVLEIAPGTYRIDRTWTTRRGGSPSSPIVLRAAQAGSVRLDVYAVQALVIRHPYWIIENLDWRGRCEHDDNCEHALHIVGEARGTVVVNNHMTDFNAHFKVNGESGRWPDDGLVQFCTLDNSRPRRTTNPVTLFDLVAASGWQFVDNRLERTVRADSSQASYALFMKGASERGRIERNVVICSPNDVSATGQRVGISLGGGGSGRGFCRDGNCSFEHRGGLVANNVVAHCNDVGIDISKAVDSWVLHNTLINTQGIGLRSPPAQAAVQRNALEGALLARQGTVLEEIDNLVQPMRSVFKDPDALVLTPLSLPDQAYPPHPKVPSDFCHRPRPMANPAGATVGAVLCRQ